MPTAGLAPVLPAGLTPTLPLCPGRGMNVAHEGEGDSITATYFRPQTHLDFSQQGDMP